MRFHTDHVAVLLATFNGAAYLPQQLDSVLAQSCTDWELFAHDDGSRDGTAEILAAYAAAEPRRIHPVEGTPRGSAKSNFLFLMEQVDAPYFMFCDQDDVWDKEKLACSLAAMKELEAENGKEIPLLVFTDAVVTDRELNVIDESLFAYQHLNPGHLRLSELLVQNVVPGNTVLGNGSLLRLARQYSDESAVVMHDGWCALVAACFGRVAVVKKSTLLYRQHGENALGAIKASGPAYVVSMLKKRDTVRQAITASRVQAGELAKAFSLGADCLPARFAAVGELPKLRRLWFYGKNGIRKSGLLRNLGFAFFG